MEHYESIQKGVIDTRDIIYFISFAAVFILSTKLVLQARKW
jgi:ABC-2 type transport system permease protein